MTPEPPGARPSAGGTCRFRVWAPRQETLAVRLLGAGGRIVPLEPAGGGWFDREIPSVPPGTRYFCRFADGSDRPDPASRHQPEGVHGPSEVVATEYPWSDGAWTGLPLEDLVFYELHVGTFTPEGTFAAARTQLRRLKEIGITAVELMPVAEFPGGRNWGYDGACPFAAQSTYGGPAGLRGLVNACHAEGLAVFLDVVYNHIGPEGNYLDLYGPYFTEAYKTPWGRAINFDGAWSDEVRAYFIGNALHWLLDFHIDGLRLDALHAIIDRSAVPFLRDLSAAVRAAERRTGRRLHLIAESDLNDRRLVLPPGQEGLGLDALWADDFHHALHAVLTGERQGYYEDFGSLEDLAAAWRDGWVYSGRHSRFRRRRHGSPAADLPARRFVVFAQNHDQVGNRMRGERLSALAPASALRLAAAAVLLSPYTPLLFMGEEYGETAPFLYFVSHGDPGLVEAVRRGRREEFAAFHAGGEPPDPQAPQTFERSKLDFGLRELAPHAGLESLHRELLRLRRTVSPLRRGKEDQTVTARPDAHLLEVARRDPESGDEIRLLLHIGREPGKVELSWPEGGWEKLLDTEEPRWGTGEPPALPAPRGIPGGGGFPLHLAPFSAVLYRRIRD